MQINLLKPKVPVNSKIIVLYWKSFSERIDKYPIFLKLYVSCWIFHEIKPCREPKCIFPKIHWTIGPIFKWELAILLGAILTFPDSKLLCKKQDWKLLHLELKFRVSRNQGTRFRLNTRHNRSSNCLKWLLGDK